MRKIIAFALLGLFLGACTPKATTGSGSQNEKDQSISSETTKDQKPPRWAPAIHSYKPSRTKYHDLIHTKLDVSFNWEKQWLIGKATLTLKPWFFETDQLTLDARGFQLNRVALMKDGELMDLNYDYKDDLINITLNKKYKRSEEYKIFIDYIAKPNELVTGGSSAIRSDKGLYFINPLGEDPHKPKQIWTQGETQASSCWFPTIDAPNERTTQEISIRVEDKYKTLSNGLLINQKKHSDGTRTDSWRMDLPHAPYLFAMAIGEFVIVKDEWRGKEVSYYVEKEYEPYAKLIFGNTPEMIELFSEKLGVDYPWGKYSQVVVRDFVSGAMENTTAVIHYSPLQHDSRAHLDATYEDVIAHELFHHWFGDLVTCESWPNLPLNESFATYGEYIWNEHKYGKDEADLGLYIDLKNYLGESRRKRETLIRYHVNDNEDMFDGHSYQKGGRVLHMLRKMLGDDAFFASLQHYLQKNAYTDVEIHELRMSFEEITGEDLNWFFNQWFLSPGHPEISVSTEYREETQSLNIRVTQNQDLRYMPVYRLPVKIAVSDLNTGNLKTYSFLIESTDTVLTIKGRAKPGVVIFDPERELLASISEKKTDEEWIRQARLGQHYVVKVEAMNELKEMDGNEAATKQLIDMFNDPFWAIRSRAFSSLFTYEGDKTDKILEIARKLAIEDPKASVRSSAINWISNFYADRAYEPEPDKTKDLPILLKAIHDSSYNVERSALAAIYELDTDAGHKIAKDWAKKSYHQQAMPVIRILLEMNDPIVIDFISQQFISGKKQIFTRLSLVSHLNTYLKRADEGEVKKCINVFKNIASEDPSQMVRQSALRPLIKRKDEEEIRAFLKERYENEKSAVIRDFLKKNLEE